MGITRIARVTGLDCIGIPVSTCIRPSSRSLTVSQGKGPTDALADVSAAMESIELFHAENPPGPTHRGSYTELVGKHGVVHPSKFVAGWFPHAAAEDSEMDWFATEDLPTGRMVLVPYVLIDFDETREGKETSRLYVSTNGLASGNTLEEATCHALYEVIERDAMAKMLDLTDEEQLDREVDPRTVDGPCRELVDRLRAGGVCVRLWEATTEIGVPAFYCLIRGVGELRGLKTFGGSGAHHSRNVAMSRALTEAAQARLTIISGTRDDVFPSDYARQQVSAANSLSPYCARTGRTFQQCADPGLGTSFSANLQDLLIRLKSQGFERVLRLNHTRSDFRIPVVHVFVPGLKNDLD
jgi:ribosomal protein S12 methylthiotransferase accessory factor